MGQLILWILDFIFLSFSKISSFLLKPIFDWAVNYDLISTNYLQIAQDFLNNYFYKYIRFAKEVIINVTGLPPNLFIILGTLLGSVFLLYIASLSLRFILNVYGLIRTGKSIGGSIK